MVVIVFYVVLLICIATLCLLFCCIKWRVRRCLRNNRMERHEAMIKLDIMRTMQAVREDSNANSVTGRIELHDNNDDEEMLMEL